MKFERAAIIGVIQVAYFGQCSTLLRFLLWLVFSRRLVSSRPRKRRRRRPRTRRRNGNAAASVRLSCSHIISQRLQHLASATWSSINKFAAAAAAVLLCCCAAVLLLFFHCLFLYFSKVICLLVFWLRWRKNTGEEFDPLFNKNRDDSFPSSLSLRFSSLHLVFIIISFFFYFNVSLFHSDGSR